MLDKDMLKGNTTYLRAIERADLPLLLEWRNNPDLRKYFREFRELSMENQNRWYENQVIDNPNVKMFAILDENKKLIGACGLCYINWVDKNADFSIYIGHNDIYIDDLYAIDAAQTMIKYGFDVLGLHRLWSEIYSFDEPKQKMFKTLGFTLDGVHKETHWHDGKWNDSLFYGLLNK
ncbi:MAG: GNAT family N-acetyltransferase [Alphaproteobacteria bacterium]